MNEMVDWKKYIADRMPPLRLPAARAAGILEELAELLEDTYNDALSAGSSHEEAFSFAAAQLPEGEALARWIEEAERPVALQFPAALRHERIQDRLMKTKRGMFMDGFLQDVRYALRMLGKNPGFTAMAVLILGLGIGANTAIFSVVNEIMVRPTPGIGEPARLVDIGRSDRGQGFDNMSYPNFSDYRQRNTTLTGMAGIDFEPRAVSLGADGGAERIYATSVSGNYFDVLQVRPQIGRFFRPEEDRTKGANPVVVLSHAFWQRRFHGDPGIVGTTIKLNGLSHAVVGVAAPEFRGTVPVVPDVWIPMMMIEELRGSKGMLDCRECSMMIAVGRLKPGVRLAQAQMEFNSISAILESEYPKQNVGAGAALFPLRKFPGTLQYMAGAFLGLLMALVGLVVVIASINIAGMMLVRAAVRRREIAIRLAIGSARTRIMRQVVTEGVVLFTTGGILALPIGIWMRDALATLIPALPVPVVLNLGLDWRVVTFALALSLVAGVAASLIPALQASRSEMLTALKDEGAGGRRSLRFRNALLVGQVALSLVLLTCAGLFTRALASARSIDAGIDMDGLHAVEVDFSLARLQEQEGTDFAYRFQDRVRSLPGVQSASWTWSIPLDGGGRGLGAFDVPGSRSPDNNTLWKFDWNVVTPGYFATMRIPLVRGRDFNENDNRNGKLVAIINEKAARSLWPDQDAVGKTFRTGDPRVPENMKAVEIIGVARDQKYRSLGDEPRNFVFVPLRQQYITRMSLMVRTPDASAVFPALRSALTEINPNLPILNILSMRQYAALSMFPQRVAGWVSGVLGVLGLLLAAMGIYGVMAFSIEQRTREIGMRMALGANRRSVMLMVIAQGMRLAGCGVVIGIVLSAAASQLLGSMLYGISTLDPLTFGAVTAIVIGAAVFATVVPARRATRVDPLVALRYQ